MSQPRSRYVKKCNASTSNPAVEATNARVEVEVEAVKTIETPLIERAMKVEAKTFEQPQGEGKPAILQSEEDDDYWPLSGKPHFEVVFTKTHLNDIYQLVLPVKIAREVPSATVPVVVTCRGKKWQMVYFGDQTMKRIQRAGWKEFAINNELKIGDACIFELVECDNDCIQFRAQILRGDFPPELLKSKEGSTAGNPFKIQ